MCGIAGLVLLRQQADDILKSRVGAMNGAIAHRGPDGCGLWSEQAAGVALAQRRLAIVDLTETGAQPMLSASGRFAMTYNGEIYNFQVLRAELEALGARFRGTSDSEVLLAAWEQWGADETLRRINGMYAIAIWDRKERQLSLARDPHGIKPLVWHLGPQGLLFASELKALRMDPACPTALDPAALTAYFRHGNVPAPWTILQDVQKLSPGTLLTWCPGENAVALNTFWSPLTAMLRAQDNPLEGPFDTLSRQGEALIGESIERQMVADVPLGAFLSGGIDSSLVAALMQQRSSKPVDTFTVGFEERAFDESPHAAAVAQHLGTRHHTLMTSGRDALTLAPHIADVYDEPFADSSQLPTFLLTQRVRQHVTVALSGDGGDELFAGYQRYGWGLKLATYQRLPLGLRQWLASLPWHAFQKTARALTAGSASDFVGGYRQFLAFNNDPAALVMNGAEHHPDAYRAAMTENVHNSMARMQLMDSLSYLSDDILVKVDRASMAVGLEVRVPLLDHTLTEWAWRIPPAMQRRHGNGKAILRDILSRHLPANLFERPKTGFAVPLAQWLRTDLRPWAESLLAREALEKCGLIRADQVLKLWQSHQSGQADHAQVLWSVLMFQSWMLQSGQQQLAS